MLTRNEIRRKAVIQAYQDLGKDEREEVDFLAEELVSRVTAQAPRARFSHSMGIELIGSIGALMCHMDEARRAVSHSQGG
jgi:hypothetical protein